MCVYVQSSGNKFSIRKPSSAFCALPLYNVEQIERRLDYNGIECQFIFAKRTNSWNLKRKMCRTFEMQFNWFDLNAKINFFEELLYTDILISSTVQQLVDLHFGLSRSVLVRLNFKSISKQTFFISFCFY